MKCLLPAWPTVVVHLGLRLLLILTLITLTSCNAMNTDRIHIRIHNTTQVDLENFWLGAGSGAGGPGSRAFGPIAAGETTQYRAIKAQFGAYSNYNFLTVERQRFIGSPFDQATFGEETLKPGYYTFVLTINGDASHVEIVSDPAS